MNRCDFDGAAECELGRRRWSIECERCAERSGDFTDQVSSALYRQAEAMEWHSSVRSTRYGKIVSCKGRRDTVEQHVL